MTRSRLLTVVAVAGVALFALSFVNAWIVHDREIRGEGYRHSVIMLSAWRDVAIPVLSLGSVAALVTAATAAILSLRPGAGGDAGWILLVGSTITLGVIASSLAPLGWDMHTTSIALRPGWATGVGLLLAAVMTVAAVRVMGRRGPGVPAILAVGLVAIFGAGVGGRYAALAYANPGNQAWREGTYVRPAADGDPSLTLSIEDGRYRIGDRWSGTWEGSGGWTVALDDDPACPGARGAYHAHDEGPSGTDLRFVMIVDPCLDGARAAELQAGTWQRQP